jgi:hypothetical protein
LAVHYSGPIPVDTVVRAAHQRHALILGAEQLALALILVFGGGILMLLAGTQILNGYWLVLLGAIGLAVGVMRYRRRALAQYTVAQILDRRLSLKDTLSTAWFLRHQSPAAEPESFATRTQLAQADEVADGIDPRPAFPVTGQRKWVAAATLAIIAMSLFGVRYFVSHTLDLRHSLIPIHWNEVLATIERHLSPSLVPQGDKNMADARSQTQDAKSDANPLPDEIMGVKNPYGSDSPADAPAAKEPNGQKADASNPDNNTPGPEGQKAGNNPQNQTASNNPQQQNTPGMQSQPNGQQGNDAQQGQQQGLMDKMKDAVSSMLSKMRPSQGQQNSQSAQQRPNQDEQGKNDGSQNEQAQAKQPGPETQQGSKESGAEGEEQSQTTEKTQNLQGRSSDKPSEKNGNEAHSGVGRQDGAKDLRDAQQQEAMGKLAEIIGKRSANLTGDVMVEVPNGKQQLRTAYSQKSGKHMDSGGEINRDEVPLMYQQYVREYMEQVHKQAGASK